MDTSAQYTFTDWSNLWFEHHKINITPTTQENYKYTLVACHIPIQFVNSRKDHADVKAEWTELLNVIQPDLAVYGHQHDLYPFLDGQETMYDAEGKFVKSSTYVNGLTR